MTDGKELAESLYNGNILNKSSGHQYKKPKNIGYNVYADLKIPELFDYCCRQYPDPNFEDELRYTLDIMRSPCLSEEDIIFRQQIFKQLMEKPDNSKKLYGIFKDVQILNKVKDNYDNTDLAGEPSEYLDAVNYVFFIKSYQLFIVSIKNFLDTLTIDKNEGLYYLKEYIYSQIAEINNEEILKTLDSFMSSFNGKREIIAELPYIKNVFNEINFDYKKDYSKNTSNLDVVEEHFVVNLKNVEDFMGLSNREKDHKFVDISDFSYIRHSQNFSPFEKRILLNIFEYVSANENSLTEKIAKIKEIHDKINLSGLTDICEQLKFYYCMCKVVGFLNSASDNFLCFPRVREGDDSFKADISDMFDPVVLIQKHSEQRELVYKNPKHEFKIGEIVTNDVKVDDQIFVITGANNGGKTSFVRALGICLLFYGAGCPIPAKKGAFRTGLVLYTHFVAEETHSVEGGRLQDELRRVGEILSECDKSGIVILNETYSGTNATKALDLFKDFLKNAKRARLSGLYVTHFHNIALHIEKMQSDNAENTNKEEIELFANCVNMKAMVDPQTGKRTFKVLPFKPSDTSHSRDIVIKHKLSWEQLSDYLTGAVEKTDGIAENNENGEGENKDESILDNV